MTFGGACFVVSATPSHPTQHLSINWNQTTVKKNSLLQRIGSDYPRHLKCLRFRRRASAANGRRAPEAGRGRTSRFANRLQNPSDLRNFQRKFRGAEAATAASPRRCSEIALTDANGTTFASPEMMSRPRGWLSVKRRYVHRVIRQFKVAVHVMVCVGSLSVIPVARIVVFVIECRKILILRVGDE